ncbi:MAG: hypothetical protein LUG13_07225 [Oscillospiraceae bacterium]|nr:hypothetical protein [Oscillospiraceae bacterium]
MNRRIRWKSTLLLVAIIASLLSGCAKTETDIAEETGPQSIIISQLLPCTFDEYITTYSNTAVIGEYIELIDHFYYIEYKFRVDEVLYGTVSDQEIYIYSYDGVGRIDYVDYSFETGGEKYTAGEHYILLMEKTDSPFFGHDQYMIAYDILLNDDAGAYTFDGVAMNAEQMIVDSDVISADMVNSQPSGRSAMAKYVTALYSTVESPAASVAATIPYRNGLEEMAMTSDFVAIVTIDALTTTGLFAPANNYICTLDELLSGGQPIYYSRDGYEGHEKLMLLLRQGEIEIGKRYIIGFWDGGSNDGTYRQKTTESIYDANDSAVLAELASYLEKKENVISVETNNETVS